MKSFKPLVYLVMIFISMSSITNCSSAQKLQKSAPADFGDVYFQKWTAGVRGGGSGINLFIPLKNKPMKLDSVYFRGKAAKLETKDSRPMVYIGRFTTKFNQQSDIILSSDMNEEAKNTLPVKTEKIPFELKSNECVVSYKAKDETKHYKITGIEEKAAQNYPSAPTNKQ